MPSMRMGKRVQHTSVATVIAAVMMASLGAEAGDKVDFDIAAKKAGDALNSYAQQAGLQLLFPYDKLQQVRTGDLKGSFDKEEALARLLKGTGFEADVRDDGSIVIREAYQVSQAMGAENVDSAIDTKEASFVLEEIIVTAQKRAQSIQDVPISISAFSSSSLEQRGVNNVSDLQNFVPGLHFGKTDLGQAVVSLRGISGNYFGIGFDPGVAIHIDGHYLQSSAFMTRDFHDVERTEVLRGPQGTLYGKNVVGGTINIITNKPTDEVEGRLDVEIGNYNQRKIKGVLNMPISNTLKGRIAVVSEDRDGYTKNLTNGERLDASDYTSFRGSLLFTPTENLEILLNGYDYRNSGTPGPGALIYGYPSADTLANFLGERISNPWLQVDVGANPTVDDRRVVRSTLAHGQDDRAQGISLDIDWSLGDYTVKLLSSYNDSLTDVIKDVSNSDIVQLLVPARSRYETFSQELQLGYDSGETFKWIAGFYYYTEDSRLDFAVGSSYDLLGAGQPSRLDTFQTVKTTSLGAFAQLDHRITDQLELTYGVRYSRDEKDFSSGFSVGVWDGDPNWTFKDFGENPNLQNDAWSKVTGRLAANYTVNDDVMLFASIASGYKAGGFTDSGSFRPETVIAYETGVKSLLWDKRLQMNLTGFYNDYQDKQESQTKNNALFVTNAASAEIYGVEAEMQARPVPALEVTTMIAYMHARFGSYTDALDVTRNVVEDLSGNIIPEVPEWKISLAAAYTWEMGDYGNITAWANFNWVDDVYLRAFNIPKDLQPSHFTSNASLTWVSVEGDWSISLFADNIEDNDITGSFATFSEAYGQVHSAILQPPRTYGLTVGYRF